MCRRLITFCCICWRGPRALATQALLCAGLGSFVGCSGPRADIPDDVFRQQILAPSEGKLGGTLAENDLTGSLKVASTKNLATEARPRPVNPSEVPSEPAPAADGSPEILTLPQVLERAARDNPRVQFLKARVEQAKAGVEVAFAEFLPTASAKYRYVSGGPDTFTFPTQPPSGSVGVVSFSDKTSDHQQTELYLQWLVYDFGRREGRHDQATLAADIAELQYQRAIETAQFNVTVAYFELLRTVALRRVAEEAIRRAELKLTDARNLLKKGLAVRNNVLRAEVLVGDEKLQMVAAERAIGVARATLNEAIGSNVNGATPVADVRQEPGFCVPLANALRLAVDNRQEFAAALRSIRSARAGRGVAAADFLPRINVSGAANFLGPEDTARTLLDGGVSIEISLFEGGRRLGRLHQADAEIRATVAQGQEVCNRIALEVNTAWLEIEEARRRVELARTILTQATENVRVVRDLFRKGDALPTEVADAELIFVRAEQNEATALYTYQTALARLAYAVGIPPDKIADLCVVPGCSKPADESATGPTAAVPSCAGSGRGAVGLSDASITPTAVNHAR